MAQGIVDQDPEVDARPGLLRGGNVVTNGSDHEGGTRWISGFSWDPDPCGGGHIVDPCLLGAGADTADTTTCTAVGPIQPYIIQADETHSTFDNRPDYYRERAKRKLLGVQSKLIEQEFWNGTKAQSQVWANNQYLKKTSGLTTLGTAPVGGVFGIVDGLAALEQAISDGSSWGRGAIHASPQLATHWAWQGLLTHAGPDPRTATLLTHLGTVVIVGSGYDGSGPQGSINPNRLEWAYATSIPTIRLGEITYNDTDTESVATVEPATNTRIVRASRFAAVTISPCFRAGVLITMTTSLQVPGS